MHLETDRLIIREFKDEDLDELAPILADPKVMEYSLSGPLSRDDAQTYLQQRILDHYENWGYGFWAIISKNTNKIIGFAGPVQQKVDIEECIEIGYRIASPEWGKGYASEAMEAIRDYTFFHLDLDKIIAIIEPNNVRSVRVAEKAGFKLSRTTIFHGFNVGIYEISRITVVPYSEKWKEQFESEKGKLEKVFGNFPIVFHHIGSTSIPGCYAKPKIDILGITPDTTAVDRFNDAMKAAGYSPLGEYGMKQRRFFTRNGKTPINLHIFEDSDPEATRHLRFRDYLRSDPEAVKEYSKLKLNLAERHPGNMYRYCLGKESFVKMMDYQAAMADTGKYLSRQVVDRKHSWSDEEILKAMEANMHLNMTYFAKYVPNIEIVFQPDVTVVSSDIPDDTFNYVIGAGFKEYDVKERVASVINHYRTRQVPFSWWVGEGDTPNNLYKELEAQGLSLKEDDIGMYLTLEGYNTNLDSSEVSITRVLDEKGLRDFAIVFADLGGYQNLYDHLYSKIPHVLIADGGPFEMYVGYLDGVPVLTGILVLHANVGGIYYVMTVPNQRRKGYGTHMMKYLICRAKEKGYHMVTLQASSDGRGLYERLGFKSLCRFVEYA